MRHAPILILFALTTSDVSAADGALCDSNTPVDTRCLCDLSKLRPLPGAIGYEEVEAKVAKIREKQKKEWKDLEKDPIEIVRGPESRYYITDHHHGAEAWRRAGFTSGVCRIRDFAVPSKEAFWSRLEAARLVRLADASGRRIFPADLPVSLAATPDDPNRSLAWYVRKAGGFCRSVMPQKEFAEFTWADWSRSRSELSAQTLTASVASTVPAAMQLARSKAARTLPQYIGDRPSDFDCSKE